MTASMGEDVAVAITTHTDYFDAERNTFSVQPILDENAEAVVPAVGLTRMQILPNREDYTARPVYVATTEIVGNQVLTGFREYHPPDVFDISFDVRLFHRRQTLLIKMIRAFQRQFARQPYLYVPSDATNVDGITEGELCDLKERFDCGEDISCIGTFLEQEIPLNEGFTSTSVSNNDNLYVAETSVMIKQILLTDDADLGFFGTPSEYGIVICDMNDPEKTPLATIDVSEEP